MKSCTKDVANDNDAYSEPILVKLSGSEALVAWTSENKGIQYSVISSSDAASTPTDLNPGFYDLEKGVQFPNGNILLLSRDNGYMQYSILGANTGTATNTPTARFKLLTGPAPLVSGATNGETIPSVIADTNGHAVVTWGDGDNIPLIYTLINSDGSLATPPMVIRTPNYPDGTYLEYMGQSLTTYSWQPTVKQDIWVSAPSVNLLPPGTTYAIPITVGNLGQLSSTSVQLTVILDGGLTYNGGDCYQDGFAPIAPVVTHPSGNTQLVYSFTRLDFLSDFSCVPSVTLPAEVVGTQHPVDLSIAGVGAEDVISNNTLPIKVIAAVQVFLPLVNK